MRLNIDFGSLDTLLQRMGAKEVNWDISGTKLPERQALRAQLAGGKEIKLDEVANLGGLLAFNGEQVLLYIKDTRVSKEKLLNKPEDYSKFHFAECKTIKDMRRGKRFSRYHVTQRFDGKFNCTWFNEDTRESGDILAELKVCMNCLKLLNWEGYTETKTKAEKTEIRDSFDIPYFLRLYETVFYSKPSSNEFTPVRSTYVADWRQKSENYRSSQRWRCEECGVNLSNHKKLLHTHHIDGCLANNSFANLKALCVLCHAAQPFHGHMGVNASEKAVIEALRLK